MKSPHVALIGIVALLVAGCASSAPAKTVTVTVGAPSSSTVAPATPTPSTPTSTAPPRMIKLPGPCDTLLTDYLVSQAIGGQQFPGKDLFIVGVPERNIGRIGYLNCRYGVTGKGASAKARVEIGVSLYGTPVQAGTRVQGTVEDYTGHGAKLTDVTVAGKPGRLLTGGVGTGYTLPLLVVASGQRTVAVTVDPSFVSAARVRRDAVAVATLALQATAG